IHLRLPYLSRLPDAECHERFPRQLDRPLAFAPIAIPRIRANDEFPVHRRDRHSPGVEYLNCETHPALQPRPRQLERPLGWPLSAQVDEIILASLARGAV